MQSDQLESRILASATDFAIISQDRDGFITSWSPGAENLLGWQRHEMIGANADQIFTPEDREVGVPASEMARARLDGRALNERWHVRKDGTRFWGSGLMMRLLGTDGQFDGFAKIMRDRTQERATEQRYNALTAAIPGFLFIADGDGHLTETNELFRTFTGRSDMELNGDHWLEAVHEDDRQVTSDRWRQSILDGSPYSVRLRFRAKDGLYRSFMCRALPDRDDDGHITRWMGTCLDVDNEARARTALERLTVALEHRVTQGTEDLASAIESLQAEMDDRMKAEEALRHAQKMEAVGLLTGGVAHDFNNLLTVIRGSAELLRKPNLAEDRRARYLDAISDTADRAAALTAQLLAFARRQPLKPVVFDAVAAVRAMEPLLMATLGSRVSYDFDVEQPPCLLLADPSQFDTAILNLVVNARDAMGGSGRLSIAIGKTDVIPTIRAHGPRTGEFVAVAICDSGPGIPDGSLAQIFEPFYTTKGVGQGTGLGLSQVHGFCKQSGGDIGVANRSEGGAIFTLYLPTTGKQVESVTAAEIQPAAAPGEGHGLILIVEDNEMVGRFATDLVEDLGYSALLAPNARAALEILGDRAGSIDAIFSDIVMPGMTGIELAQRVRAEYPAMPIVLTSGYSHILAQEGSHGFELLQKPYSAEGLERVLSRLLTLRTDG
ncbi:PAS domain S-box protein [Sphingomonas sp. BIUV-7]|uniref:histidine kinase n=1 Tax=Sphingomonas natans TaxID=3063330 RepID=A0ABT8Y718_9SPHN|nr:PAS domain-containing sensor histidine kinase [Sphingomonas sp. BIUV-7]MDO6414115.1 PAS domain S-box protein [Sphingomonas sp. BIUV-7]